MEINAKEIRTYDNVSLKLSIVCGTSDPSVRGICNRKLGRDDCSCLHCLCPLNTQHLKLKELYSFMKSPSYVSLQAFVSCIIGRWTMDRYQSHQRHVISYLTSQLTASTVGPDFSCIRLRRQRLNWPFSGRSSERRL